MSTENTELSGEVTSMDILGESLLIAVSLYPGGAGRMVKNTISVNDRVSVFIELAEAHRLLGEQVTYHLLLSLKCLKR